MANPTWDETKELAAPKWDETSDVKASAPAPAAAPGWFEPGSKSDAVTRGFSQMATLGFGDESQAALRAFLDSNKNPGESYVDAYRRLRDEDRTNNSNAQQANPGSYLAGGAIAAAPTLLATAPKIATLGSFNAIQGALAGAGNSDSSTAGGVANDTAKGFVEGALLGKAGELVGKGITSAANGVKTFADKSVGNVLAKSEDKFKSALGGAIQNNPSLVDQALQPTFLKDALPSAVSTAKAVGNTIIDNVKSNTKKGIDTGDLVLGGLVGMVAGPHAGIGTVLGKKALVNASVEAGKQHMDEIGNAARPLANTAAKFAPVVQRAVERGTPFAAINNILQQQSPEYRQMLREQEKQDNNDQ